MSPRTSTWTEILGSFTELVDVALGGEWLTCRLGNIRRTSVKNVERITVADKSTSMVEGKSNIVMWLQMISGQTII